MRINDHMTISRYLPVLTLALTTISLPCAAQDAVMLFEQPPVLKASEILEPAVLRSPLHHVSEEVTTVGYANGYVLNSQHGARRVSGTAVLRREIHEIKAIAEIEKLKSTKEFTEALAKAAKSPLAAAKNLIADPIDTIANIPRGALRILDRAREGMRGKKKSEYEDGSLKSMVGFSKAKRQLAYRLKVDPYSSNPALQKELDNVAWANFAGDMVVSAGLIVASGGAATAISGLRATDDFAQMIRDSNPTDLQIANRKRLEGMQIDKAGYKMFLDNRWYSPTSETALVALLHELGGVAGRDIFVKAAASAESEAGALYYLQTARLMVRYHKGVAKLEGIANFFGMPVCYDGTSTLVVPLYWDYCAWTERGAGMVDELLDFPVRGKPATSIHIYLSGGATARVRKELAAREISFTEKVFAFSAVRREGAAREQEAGSGHPIPKTR